MLNKKKELFDKFSSNITESRKERIIDISSKRTRHVVLVLEDIYQPHNASAVLRSAECFGVQDIYIIEQENKFELSETVAKGAGKWLNIKKFNKKGENNTKACFDELRSLGYKIAATTPGKDDSFINKLPIEGKVALVFGTEQQGLSAFALENADCFVKIPMHGFTESFNISVSAGICLYDLVSRLKESNVDWKLSESELIDLRFDWLVESVPATFSEIILDQLKN